MVKESTMQWTYLACDEGIRFERLKECEDERKGIKRPAVLGDGHVSIVHTHDTLLHRNHCGLKRE